MQTMLIHPNRETYLPLIQQGLSEDIGYGDLTSNIFVSKDAIAKYSINARSPLILCGVEVARQTFLAQSPEIKVEIKAQDSAQLKAGDCIMIIEGNARNLLASERTALNFLQYLSGIATFTHKCTIELAGTNAQLLDTRKTLPAYRALAKYAVKCGGGRNHRLRLDDGVLIKDNHIALCGDLKSAINLARQNTPALTKIEVECDNLAQVEQAIAARADVIMLDNMDIATIKAAVEMVAGRIPLEASGGITLNNLRQYAQTGVDFISMGALTHSVIAADIGMDFEL